MQSIPVGAVVVLASNLLFNELKKVSEHLYQ